MTDHTLPKARKACTTPVCVDCDHTTNDVAALSGAAGFDGGPFPNSYATS